MDREKRGKSEAVREPSRNEIEARPEEEIKKSGWQQQRQGFEILLFGLVLVFSD